MNLNAFQRLERSHAIRYGTNRCTDRDGHSRRPSGVGRETFTPQPQRRYFAAGADRDAKAPNPPPN
jgi:hypothetical protein